MTQVTLGSEKKKNFSGVHAPLEAYAFDARFGKRSVFILDPRLLAICRAKAVSSFLSYFRPGVSVRSGESNPRPPALQSSALPTELFLSRVEREKDKKRK